MSTLRILGLAALALALLAAPRLSFAGTDPVEPPTPTVLDANPEEVEKLTAALEKANADGDKKLLAAALSDMDTHIDDSFKPFIKKAMSSKDKKVQALAIRAAASHDMESEKKQVLKLLKASKKGKAKKGKPDISGVVAAAAVDYLARLAIEGVEKQVLEQLDRLFLVESRMNASYAPDLVRAAVHYLGQTKEMSAVPRLVAMLPEPVPANPNAANNPPATYWEARYEIWQASEGWVRWALKEITGQQYRTHREWKAWVAQNEKKFK
jgi:hypothetical protein